MIFWAGSLADFARGRLGDPQAAAPVLLDSLRRLLGIDAEPRATHLQRWSLARPAAPARSNDRPILLTRNLIGACGDGWAATPKVEGAYLSGLELGEALVRRLG